MAPDMVFNNRAIQNQYVESAIRSGVHAGPKPEPSL